jgi:hypothetical protein
MNMAILGAFSKNSNPQTKQKGQKPSSTVLAESVPTFSATEKLRRRFITATSLHLPNKHFHVPTFRTFHAHFRHDVNFIIFANGYDLLLQVMFDGFGGSFCFNFGLGRFKITAFSTAQRNAVFSFSGYQTGTAIRTKLHYNPNLIRFIPIERQKLLINLPPTTQQNYPKSLQQLVIYAVSLL